MNTLRIRNMFLLVTALAVMFLLGCGGGSDNAGDVDLNNNSILSKNASSHIGKYTTVCGSIIDSQYAANSNGKPTFLNYDFDYPKHTFTVVIWGNVRNKFPANPENYYLNKNVCATGLIEKYKGKPQIVPKDANQLEIKK